ncbi:GGDEF domain-containing protein [Qipengyuania zhejiangensis]|uniref:GGDEF domain-containing protein n=1 Tax=Qipengyuania zhejiangensis TaxID=3077782 RepID=UPI002D7A020F|nr:diguanylate cyclase [Qipengyuania sp. Z2]
MDLFSPPDLALRKSVDAALAETRRVSDWPKELRQEWNRHRESTAATELAFQLKLGLAVIAVSSLLDFLVMPDVAIIVLAIRAAFALPLTYIALWLLRRGKVAPAKLAVMATLSFFAATAISISSFGSSDVIARYSMATVVLLAMALQALPFTMTEKVRFALVYSLATFIAGLLPHALPAELMLQHMVFLSVSAVGAVMLARRVWMLEARDFLRSLKHGFVRLDLEQSNSLLRELSESDPLTGLANRRTIERVYAEMADRAGDGKIAVMMIDLDHFKRFNDQFGHQAGDQCLVQVCREIEYCLLRHGGHAARFGGEEFVAILIERGPRTGMVVAEELRRKIAALDIIAGPHMRSAITASIGVCAASGSHSMGHLIARADEALYRAKQRGRNRVELAYSAMEELD